MNDSELKKLILKIEKNHKDLTTKYRVLVKRTDSIILIQKCNSRNKIHW